MHFGRPVGSVVGEDRPLGVGDRVASATDRVALGAPGAGALTVGAPQDRSSAIATSKRSIVGR
jgi:hypothetical protein